MQSGGGHGAGNLMAMESVERAKRSMQQLVNSAANADVCVSQ